MLACNVVGYGYDGELFCEDCARKAGLDLKDDPEVWPLFAEGDYSPYGEFCSTCREELIEPVELDSRPHGLMLGERGIHWDYGNTVAVMVLDSTAGWHRGGQGILDEKEIVDATFELAPWTDAVAGSIHEAITERDAIAGKLKLPNKATIAWIVVR